MSDILRVRLPENLKDEVVNLYDSLGITLTQAVKMFFKQSVIDGGLPFQPHLDKQSLLIDDDLTEEEVKEIKRRLKTKSKPIDAFEFLESLKVSKKS